MNYNLLIPLLFMVLDAAVHASIVEFDKLNELGSIFERLPRISFKCSIECNGSFLFNLIVAVNWICLFSWCSLEGRISD